MYYLKKKIHFLHISAIIQIFLNNRNQYLKSINILCIYIYYRICHSIFSLFTDFQKKIKKKIISLSAGSIQILLHTTIYIIMVIMVQKKGIRFPQSGWHIHRVILHLCIPGSPRRWSAIPEDSVFSYVTKFSITYTLPRLDFHLFKYGRFLAQRSTCIPKGVSSRIDPTVYAYAHTVVHPFSP